MADGGDLPGAGEYDNENVCSIFASIINQRQSVERLLNWLRESQTTCTDTNCFDDINVLPGTEHGSQVDNPGFGDDHYSESDTFTLVLWFVVGMLTLYVMNLAGDRNGFRSGVKNKASRSSNGGNNDDDHNRFRRDNDDDHGRPAL